MRQVVVYRDREVVLGWVGCRETNVTARLARNGIADLCKCAGKINAG